MSGINIYYPGPRGNSQFPDNNEDEAHDYTEGEVIPGDIYLKKEPLTPDNLSGPDDIGEGTIYIAEKINDKIVWKKIGKYSRGTSRYNGKKLLIKNFDERIVKVRNNSTESEIDTRNYMPPPYPNRVWIPTKKFIGRIHFEPYGGLPGDGYNWPSGTEGSYPYDGAISASDKEKYRFRTNVAVKNSIITDLGNDQANANVFVGTTITTTDTNQEYRFNETTLTFVETAFKDLKVISGGNIYLGKPTANTDLAADITIDVHENKLRIFENGGGNRGGYFEVTNLPGGIGALLNTYKSSTPSTNKGASGDTKGQYAVSGNDLYICNTSYTDGTANIWVKITGTSSW